MTTVNDMLDVIRSSSLPCEDKEQQLLSSKVRNTTICLRMTEGFWHGYLLS